MKHPSRHVLPQAVEWGRLLNRAINPTLCTYNAATALLPRVCIAAFRAQGCTLG